MEYTRLKNLTGKHDSGPIRVRVCRMWDAINSRRGDLLSLDMVVADEEGSFMWGQIRRSMVARFRQQLVVGSVYVITNYSVAAVTGEYRPVDSLYKLSFTLITAIRRVSETIPSIPVHAFCFVAPSTIMARINDNTFLTDVAGVLATVGDIETVSGGYRKRDLELFSDFSVNFRVTIWAEAAERFIEEYNVADATGPMVFVFCSMKVKQYQDVLNFSTTGATEIYVNPDHSHAASLAARYNDKLPTITLNANPLSLSESIEAAMFHNRMTVTQILRAEWRQEKTGYKMTFLGTISSICAKHGWFYTGCRTCSKKVVVVDGSYTCETCAKTYDVHQILYKVLFYVCDGTDKLMCVAMNRCIERMVDSSASKIFNRLDSGSNEFPKEILQLVGQKFVFQIRLTEYNLNSGGDVFSVYDSFIPDMDLEHKRGLLDPPVDKVAEEVVVDGPINVTPRKRRLSGKGAIGSSGSVVSRVVESPLDDDDGSDNPKNGKVVCDDSDDTSD